MQNRINELERIAEELRQANRKLAEEIRDGGRQSQEGFEKVMQAVHRIYNLLFLIPQKLSQMAKDLKEKG